MSGGLRCPGVSKLLPDVETVKARVVRWGCAQYKPRGQPNPREHMPDFATQRFNMVESQIRTSDVTDERILAAMGEVPRERFVPAAKRGAPYVGSALEVAQGRYLMDPRNFAKLLQIAVIQPGDRVLDVACATGYSSAVLAKLAKTVIALEQDADLVRVASDMLLAVGASNVTVVQGSLADGTRQHAPFDVIVVNGAIESEPKALLAQLAEGGRLVAIVQRGAQGQATLFLKENGHVSSRADFDASSPMLAGFRQPAGFVF